MKKLITTSSLVLSTVSLALAQTINVNTATNASVGQINAGPLTNFLKLVSSITGMLAPILVSLAVLAFFWYLIVFIWKGKDDGEQKKAGITGMMYSILALFVMVSVWGIIALVGSTLGVGQGGSVPIPSIPVLQ